MESDSQISMIDLFGAPPSGRWEKLNVPHMVSGAMCAPPNFRCSACKKYWFHNGEMLKYYNYCPNCGAKMKRGEDDDAG